MLDRSHLRQKLFALFSLTLALVPLHAASQPVKIGFLAELSGTQAALGQDMVDGFMLRVNNEGGKLGGVPVEVIKADTRLKPEVAIQAVQKFIEKDKVPIIAGVTFSNVMMAVYKPITEQGVFLIGTNAGPSSIAGSACSSFFYSTSWQNDQQAEVVGKYATDNQYKRILTMVPNYESGTDFVKGFKRFYKTPLVDEIYTPLSQLDFSAELTQVAASKPDAVFAFYPGALGVAFIRQYQQMGLLGKIPLLTASTTDAINLPALKDTALGVVTGTAWGIDHPAESNKQFVAAFEKAYSRLPSHYAAQSYDGAQLIASALAKVKGDLTDKEAFKRALKQADFKSVRGDFRFNNNNFPVQNMSIFRVAKDAQGRVSLATIGTPLKAHEDAYHTACALK